MPRLLPLLLPARSRRAGSEAPLAGDALEAALAYIRARPRIFEVIFTGGDPLMLSPPAHLGGDTALAAIPHVQVLRWHSRVPVVDPDRITPDLVTALRAPGKAVYAVLHANHPRELENAARAACARLIDAAFPC